MYIEITPLNSAEAVETVKNFWGHFCGLRSCGFCPVHLTLEAQEIKAISVSLSILIPGYYFKVKKKRWTYPKYNRKFIEETKDDWNCAQKSLISKSQAVDPDIYLDLVSERFCSDTATSCSFLLCSWQTAVIIHTATDGHVQAFINILHCFLFFCFFVI